VGSRGEDELTLLALLEWQQRTARWLRVPETARVALVSELARLMTRVASEQSGDERQGKAQRPTS
jgi:hypothetical protein